MIEDGSTQEVPTPESLDASEHLVEDTVASPDVYTLTDEAADRPTPTPSFDDYPTLKAVVGIATRKHTPDDTPQSFYNEVDTAYESVVTSNRPADTALLKMLASKGEFDKTQALLTDMFRQNTLLKEVGQAMGDDVRAKIEAVTREAAETIATSNQTVLINNTPEQVAKQVDTLTSSTSAQIQLEKDLKDGMTIFNIGKGIGAGMLPHIAMGEGFALDAAAIKSGVDPRSIGLTTGWTERVALLQSNLAQVPDEKKAEWLNNLLKNAKDSNFASDLAATAMVMEVAQGVAEEWNGFNDYMVRIGGIGAFAGIVTKLGVAGSLVSKANKLSTLERTVAAAGGKATLESANAAALIGKMSTNTYLKAGGTVAAEVTGVAAAMDLAKLTAFGLRNTLPASVLTSSPKLQKLLSVPVESLQNDLRNVISTNAINAEEALNELKQLDATYSKARDSSILSATPAELSADGRHMTLTLLRGTQDGSSFATAEAAQKYIALKDPSNLLGMRVIPDTTNAFFNVSQEVVQKLKLEKTALEAQRAELILNMAREQGLLKGSTSPVKAGVAAPEGASSLKAVEAAVEAVVPPAPSAASVRLAEIEKEYATLLESSSVAGKGDVAKMRKELSALEKSKADYSPEAIKALTKQLQQIEKLSFKDATKEATKRLTDKKLDIEASITSINKQLVDNASGAKVQNQLGEIEKEMATLRKEVAKEVTSKASAGLGVRADGTTFPRGTIEKQTGISSEALASFFNDTTLKQTGSVKFTNNVHGAVSKFVSTMESALGMTGHNIVVVQKGDLIRKGDKYSKEVLDYINAEHFGAGGVWIPVPNKGSLIVLRSEVDKGVSYKQYMETFAHEYAHAFEHVFTVQHGPTMISNYKKFMTAKGLGKIDNAGIFRVANYFPVEAMLEYRGINSSHSLTDFVNRWNAGGMEEFNKIEPDLRAWASSHSEFFAEQFTRWAFTEEIPTTILGQAFKALGNGFKLIADAISDSVKGYNRIFKQYADVNTVGMMNEHIKRVQDGVEMYKGNINGIAKMSMDAGPTLEGLTARIASLETRLADSLGSSEGLVHGHMVEHNISKALTYDAIGKFDPADIAGAHRWAMGDYALETSTELYTKRLVGTGREGKITDILTRYVRDDVEKLSRAEKVALDNALVLGDKEGKVFTDMQLRGMGMTENSQLAYYKIRQVRDAMYYMRDDVASRSLHRNGFVRLSSEDIKIAPDGPNVFGKEITPPSGAHVHDVTSNGDTPFSVEQFKAKGLKVYSLYEPVVIHGKPRKTIAVRADRITPSKIEQVIPYRVGEFSRKYTDEYFIKINGEHILEGLPSSHAQAHRTASSAKLANKYVESFNEAFTLHRAGKLTDAEASRLMEPFGWSPTKLRALFEGDTLGKNPVAQMVYNRTDDDFLSQNLSIGSSWSSKRGEQLPDVFGDTSANVMSPLDSLASEIGNTAYVASVAEWRESSVVKWFNTFQHVLNDSVKAMSPENAFMHMHNNKHLFVAGPDHDKNMSFKMMDYIVSQLHIPTQEEKLHLGFMRTVSESLEGKSWAGKGTETVGMFLRNTENWPNFLRTISFHSYFALSPIQTIVQGMNAFNAVALSPVHGLAATKAAPLLYAALFSDNEKIWRNVAKLHKLTSLGIGDVDDFVETVRAINRSGLLRGMSSSTLYGAEAGRYGIFNGLTRKASAVASFPFKVGDEGAKVLSFDIARREFKTANPGVAWWTNDNLATIIKRQDDLTQNLSSANVAAWQKGWKSVPTQFFQYPIKIAMNTLHGATGSSKAMSRKDVAQLLTAHALFFGTAGFMIPSVRGIVADTINENVEDPTIRLATQQGAVAGFISHLTEGEVNLALGKRLGTFRAFEEFYDALKDPEKGWASVLAGASGGAIVNILGGAGQLLSTLHHGGYNAASVQEGVKQMAVASSSSVSNYYKSQWAREAMNTVESKASGGKMYQVSETEAKLLAWGLPPVAAYDADVLFKTNKQANDELKTATKEVGRLAMLARHAWDNGDVSSYDVHYAQVNVIANKFSPVEYNTIMNAFWKSDEGTKLHTMIIESAAAGRKPIDVIVNNKLGSY
jgi:hypothetical protein